MATTRIATEYLQSGWCERCGYKRTLRGNCPNCDHWYTHPVLTVGGTIAASLALLLFVGVRAIRDADPNYEKLERGLLVSAPPSVYVPSLPVASVRTAPPIFFQSVAPASVSFAKEATPAIEKQAERLEDLRDTVHTASRAYRRSLAAPGAPRATQNTALREMQSVSATAIF